MYKNIFFLVAVSFFLAFFSSISFCEEIDQDAVLKDIGETAKNINSYQVDYVLEIEKEGETVKSVGYIKFQEPDMFFMRLELPDLEGMSQVFVSDGETMWQYLPYMQMATKINLSKAREKKAQEYMNNKADIRNPFQDLKEDSVKITGQEKQGNDTVYIIEGEAGEELKEDAITDISNAKIWISSGKGIPEKIIWYDDEGNTVITQDFMNIKTNLKMDKDQFTFNPPEGTEVVDVTEDLEQEQQ